MHCQKGLSALNQQFMLLACIDCACRHLEQLGYSQGHLSLASGILGMTSLPTTVLILLLQCVSSRFAGISGQTQCMAVLAALLGGMLCAAIMLAWPRSYVVLVVARGCRGRWRQCTGCSRWRCCPGCSLLPGSCRPLPVQQQVSKGWCLHEVAVQELTEVMN